MPNLKTLLRDTLLLAADPSPDWRSAYLAPDWSALAFPQNDHWRFRSIERHPDWLRVNDLDYNLPSRAMHHGWTRVCDEVTFSRFVARYQGKDYALPFDDSYLLAWQTSGGGALAEDQHVLWPLQVEVAAGLQWVYGYELHPSGLRRFPGEALRDDWSFEDFSRTATGFTPFMPMPPGSRIAGAGLDQRAVVRVSPARLIVCVSLIGCEPNNRFEPFTVLDAARLYPTVMVLSNASMERFDASISLLRPVQSLAHGTNFDMVASLYTDRNNEPGPHAPPHWDKLFDYYELNPRGKTYEVVRSRAVGGTPGQGSAAAQARLVVDGAGSYRPTVVEKVARQGAYDNVHIAPTLPNGLDLAYMAPICAHDCLHTHFRWGRDYTERHVRGWDRAFNPHAEVGAPMVPTNQDVSIRMLPGGPGVARGYEYRASVRKLRRLRWEPIMHHGCAYAVALAPVSSVMSALFQPLATSLNALDAVGLDGWARFYLGLRYADANRTLERVRFAGGDQGRTALEDFTG